MVSRVNPKSFAKAFNRNAVALQGLAANLHERPTKDEIHDLRVAIRRIQAMGKLLPKVMRSSPETARLHASLRSALKATSRVRDTDVLGETIGTVLEAVPPGVLVNLENQRSYAAVTAVESIRPLGDLAIQRLNPSELRRRKLAKRLRKLARRKVKRIASLSAVVIRDETKIEELHVLRIIVKSLRYHLECAQGPRRKLSSLIELQELLGKIHDLDMAIIYVRGTAVEGIARIEGLLQAKRHDLYLRLVREIRLGAADKVVSSELI